MAAISGDYVAQVDTRAGVERAVVLVRMREAAGVVRGELSRVDAKAATLLALVGAALAVVASTLTGWHGLAVPVLMVAWIGAGCLGVATVLLLAALRPRLAGNYGFVVYAKTTPTALFERFANLADLDQAHEVVGLSTLALAKFRRLRYAVDLTLAGLVLLSGSAVLAAALGGVS